MTKPKNKSHWDRNDPGQVARDKLRKEIKAGRIEKPSKCQLCGNGEGQIVGHHFKGYAFPLEVWWVCIGCNTKLLKHDGSVTMQEAQQQMQRRPVFVKNDNSNMTAKLHLRSHFLSTYHKKNLTVFDCCQGDGHIWNTLRASFNIQHYWGVDLKTKSGRLKVDSIRILQQGIRENVIDIDTYGSPWSHWTALINHLDHAATIFLTSGELALTGINKDAMKAIGLGSLDIPHTLKLKLHNMAADYLLSLALERFDVVECSQIRIANMRYIGIHIQPKK